MQTLTKILLISRTQELPNLSLRLIIEFDIMDNLLQDTKNFNNHLHTTFSSGDEYKSIKLLQRLVSFLKSVVQSRTEQENLYFLCCNIRQPMCILI